jgi:hypothetical protein
MKKKTWVILLVCIVAVGAIGGVVAWMQWNKPHAKVEDQDGILVSAADLCNSFAADETKANGLYLGKVLEVSGTATEQQVNDAGQLVVTLQGANPDVSVLCTMRDKNVTVENEKPVVLKGTCSGNDMFGVLLTDCIVLK